MKLTKLFSVLALVISFLAGLIAPAQPGMLANREYRRAHPGEYRTVSNTPNALEKAYVYWSLWVEDMLALSPAFATARAERRAYLVNEYHRMGMTPYWAFGIGANMTLVQKRAELAEKQKRLHVVFEEAGPEMDMGKVKSLEGDSRAKVEQIQSWDKELNDLADEVKNLAELDAIAKKTAGFQNFQQQDSQVQNKTAEQKSLGRLFVESEAYTGRGENTKGSSKVATFDVELKTLMETGAGWAPDNIRTGLVVPYATRPIRVVDIIPMGRTSQAAVVYMEETTFTNNAAEAAEGAAYGEAALVLTERSSAVRKIAVWLPVTDEQLEDIAQVESYINNRLTFMLRQRLDLQILVGNGSAPNLRGVLNVSGIQTQAKGADPTPDAVYKAMVKVRGGSGEGFADPNAVVLHPNDWQDIRLLRTADGLYIWGSPSEPGLPRLWGLPVVESTAETENTGLVGDFANFSQLDEKRGIEVSVGYVNDDFVKGKKAIRADVRVAFTVYRPKAFCTVTGI